MYINILNEIKAYTEIDALKDALATKQVPLVDGHRRSDRLAVLVDARARAAHALYRLVVAIRRTEDLEAERLVHRHLVQRYSALFIHIYIYL